MSSEINEIKATDQKNYTYKVGSVSFSMIYVQGGTFTMGSQYADSPETSQNELPAHNVTLNSYYLGETEVTQALWKAVMGENPSWFKGTQRPVEQVSWKDCKTFVDKLNSLLSGQLPSGRKFRLPTEAEWEYAARGGIKAANEAKYAGSDDIGDVAWYGENSNVETHNVKTKQCNALGLYDMSGNVWEWCQDWYGNYDSEDQTNPTGPGIPRMVFKQKRRFSQELDYAVGNVFRGGGWDSYSSNCRVSNRRSYVFYNINGVNFMTNYIGLRLAL